MKTQLVLFAMLISISNYCLAQKDSAPVIVEVKGESTVQWYEDAESKKQAQQRAEELASINALEQAFGVVIVQGNTTFIENKQTGQKVETHTTFKTIGNTMVKGEIVEVIKKKFTDLEQKEVINRKKVILRYIKCEITINAKELTETRIEIETFPLSRNMKNFQTTTFYSEDEFYLYFKSPISGYITVFLDNDKTAERVLPYEGMPTEYEDKGIPVEPDKEYIFFSLAPEHDYFANIKFTPYEIVLVPEQQKEINRMYVIFSKSPLDKPSLKENMTRTEDDIQNNYKVPKAMESEKFQRWLIHNREIRTDMQVETIFITVEKKN